MSGGGRRRLSQVLAIVLAIVPATVLATTVAAWLGASVARPVAAAEPSLPVVAAHRAVAAIVVAPQAGPLERRAATDLVDYVARMTGARLEVADGRARIDALLASTQPVIVLGEEAFRLDPALRARLSATLKPHPFLRADGIALKREGTRVLVAGANERSHYFAVAELLRSWGVRWFMPGAFGECVPDASSLAIGPLDRVEATPFEARTFWVSSLGDQSGLEEFRLRNLMTDRFELPPAQHALGHYTAGIGRNAFDVPLLARSTAVRVAARAEAEFAAGKDFSLSMEDGIYASGADGDAPRRWDEAFHTWSVTDRMLSLYGNVLAILRAAHPDSPSKVGFLAYSNMTLPPVAPLRLDGALFAQLAPIAVDPNHGIGDPRSPERNVYGAWVRDWAAVMGGRLAIYDYDQGMLVWRDLPDPSFPAFERDVKAYRDAGVLGVNTESRNALATTLINLYLRARLMWNPDQPVGPLLDDFYRSFYGPAAGAMSRYWGAIFAAWQRTAVVEHEYFAAPAIYTAPLLAELRSHLAAMDEALRPLAQPGRLLTRNEALYVERARFTHLGFDVLDAYVSMVAAGAGDADYRRTVAAGRRGLAARDALQAMNPAFVTTKLETGSAYWPGEVEQYAGLEALTDGTRGRLVARLPLVWSVARGGFEPSAGSGPSAIDVPPADLLARMIADPTPPADGWRDARADLYLEAQQVFPAAPRATQLWYRAAYDLGDEAGAPLRLHLPGVFGTCAAYNNGNLIGGREQDVLWWHNDYRLDWDLPLAEARRGGNTLTVGCASDGRMGSLFRRPFIYRPS